MSTQSSILYFTFVNGFEVISPKNHSDTRSYMLKKRLFIFIVCLTGFACSQSDAQREFENQAFSFPENITETTRTGPVEGGTTDPDDWRIGPDFRGLIDVQRPAYPNPVILEDILFIELDLFENTVSGLKVFVFRDPMQQQLVDEINRVNTFETLNIPPSLFANSGGVGQSSLYRILITDERENVITYGDVEVTQ